MQLREYAANRIRAIRKGKDLTVEQAAKMAGVGRRTWQRWESGVPGGLINLDMLVVAAHALDAKVVMWVEPADSQVRPAATPRPRLQRRLSAPGKNDTLRA